VARQFTATRQRRVIARFGHTSALPELASEVEAVLGRPSRLPRVAVQVHEQRREHRRSREARRQPHQPGLFTRLRRESSVSEANRGRARSSAARTKDARREAGELAAEGVVNNPGYHLRERRGLLLERGFGIGRLCRVPGTAQVHRWHVRDGRLQAGELRFGARFGGLQAGPDLRGCGHATRTHAAWRESAFVPARVGQPRHDP
jgi:hypothetical protein